jgi:hypothetical protein
VRQTRFRGKQISGEWVYGNLTVLLKKVGPIEPGTYISNSAGLPFAYSVIAETVSEFTGAKDRKGTAVYEADILYSCCETVNILTRIDTGEMKENYNIVKWLPEKCCFSSDGVSYLLSSIVLEFKEVIGNIYDNPELLAVGDSKND